MGMDVYGKNPTEKSGEYFRRNVWGWHPLWDYCLDMHPDISQKVKYGHSNDGDGLGAVNSRKLAKRLKEDIISGNAQKYIEDRDIQLANLEQVVCYCCHGKKTIKVEKNSLQINAEQSPTLNDCEYTIKECHVCNGTGLVDSWDKNYFLSLQDIQQFCDFLQNCGGFEIC